LNLLGSKVSKFQGFRVSKTCRKPLVSMAISGKPVKQRQLIAEVRGQIAEVKTHTPDNPGSGMQLRSNGVTSAI